MFTVSSICPLRVLSNPTKAVGSKQGWASSLYGECCKGLDGIALRAQSLRDLGRRDLRSALPGHGCVRQDNLVDESVFVRGSRHSWKQESLYSDPKAPY